MDINITLDGRIGRFDIGAIAVTENEGLAVTFKNLSKDKLFRHIATFMNGNKGHIVTVEADRPIYLDSDFLQGGDAVEVYLETRIAKGDRVIVSSDASKDGYLIEPLKLEKVGVNRLACGWMSKIEAEMQAQLLRIVELEKELALFKDAGVPLIVEK